MCEIAPVATWRQADPAAEITGGITGNIRVFNRLSVLTFDFPPSRADRSEFSRPELEQLPVLSTREGIAASSLRGSFAGAIGLPQFMPGSINRWAVDFDKDGHIDLRRNAADAITRYN